MATEVTYTLTKDHVRQASWANVRRLSAISGAIAFALLVAAWGVMMYWDGAGAPVVVGVLAGAIAFFALGTGIIALGAQGTCASFSDYLGRFREPRVTARFADEGVTFQDEFTTSRLPWSFVTEVRRLPDVWLVSRLRINYHIIPVEALAPDLQDFIVRRVTENGGKVM
jgi:hypothetical protein